MSLVSQDIQNETKQLPSQMSLEWTGWLETVPHNNAIISRMPLEKLRLWVSLLSLLGPSANR